VAYLTTKAVHEELALRMAHECGVTLCSVGVWDIAPDDKYDAVLFDWDGLPHAWRQLVLGDLLAGPTVAPVAVHGRQLAENEVALLRRRGVAIYRQLQPEVFQLLRLATGHGRARRASGLAGDEHPEQEEPLARRLQELRQERRDGFRRRLLSCLQSAITDSLPNA
jgi:hypothetical protein